MWGRLAGKSAAALATDSCAAAAGESSTLAEADSFREQPRASNNQPVATSKPGILTGTRLRTNPVKGIKAGDYGLDPALGFTIRAMMAATIEATRAHIRMTLG